MQDISQYVASLQRPRLLVQAANHGLDHYERSVDLKRIIGTEGSEPTRKMLMTLVDKEAQLEHFRRSRDHAYSVASHVDVLIALIFEAREIARMH